MNIPKRLKILGHIYTIRYCDCIDSDENILGQCDQEKLTIKLKNNLPETILEKCLLHEIFHAINWELTEEQIESFANSLYQVLKDNNLIK